MMCLYKLQVHCTFEVSEVEHSYVIDDLFAHCSLSFCSTRCLLITLMKPLLSICTS